MNRIEDDMGRIIKLGSILEPDVLGIGIQENLLNLVSPSLHAEVIQNIGRDPRYIYTYLTKETAQTIKHFTEWVTAGDYKMTQRTFHGFNLLVLHGRVYTMAAKYLCNELQTCVTIHIHRLLVMQRHIIQPCHDIEFLDYLAEHHSIGQDHLRRIMVKKVAFDIKRYIDMPQFEAFCKRFPRVAFEIMKELSPATIDPIAPLVINHEGVFILGDSPLKRLIARCLAEKMEKLERERVEREREAQAYQAALRNY
jgi:translation initiation factor 2 beta subunit (eIF-2beta)/eIF-5